MSFQLLSLDDAKELTNAWNQREAALVEKTVVRDFICEMVEMAIEKDLKSKLLEAVKHATSKEDLWVTAGICYDPSHRFTLPNRNKWLSIKQLIYRTDALSQLARQLGPGILVRPLYKDGLIFFKYEFWPSTV
jgi:hypothetical protein